MCDQVQSQPGLEKTPYTLEIGTPCVKCKTRPISIVIRQAAYCNECFQEVAYHKYRVNVFKTRSGSTGTERVLVAMSTGQASRLLLFFTQLTKIQDPNRRNMDAFFPVHILEDASEDTSELRAFVKEMGLEYVEVPLHSVFDIECSGNDETKAKLDGILASIKSFSVKEDLIAILRRRVLIQMTKKLQCKRIFLGETNDRMAINVMADVCAGRGATVPWFQLPLQLYGRGDIGTVRPLREAQALEVPEYLKLIGYSLPNPPEPAAQNTIYGLTDSFISNLAVDYTSTPSIVTRTAAKVNTEGTPLDPSIACSLCWCPVKAGQAQCLPCKDLLAQVPSLDVDYLVRCD